MLTTEERFNAICIAREVSASFNQVAEELAKGGSLSPSIPDELEGIVTTYCAQLRATFTG